MKKMYIPQVKNDKIFTFVGSLEGFIYVLAVLVLLVLLVYIILKKRKGGKK